MLRDSLRRVVAQLVHHVVRVGADHRHELQVFPQWQQVLVILEQYDAFASSAQGQLLVRLRVNHLDGAVRVDIRILKEAEAELLLQHAAHRAIHECRRNSALLHALDQRPHVGGFVGNVHIDAGPQGEQTGFLLGGTIRS